MWMHAHSSVGISNSYQISHVLVISSKLQVLIQVCVYCLVCSSNVEKQHVEFFGNLVNYRYVGKKMSNMTEITKGMQ